MMYGTNDEKNERKEKPNQGGFLAYNGVVFWNVEYFDDGKGSSIVLSESVLGREPHCTKARFRDIGNPSTEVLKEESSEYRFGDGSRPDMPSGFQNFRETGSYRINRSAYLRLLSEVKAQSSPLKRVAMTPESGTGFMRGVHDIIGAEIARVLLMSARSGFS